ncbi:MAG: hypothetical protein OXR66_05115 [Candidatus Woesearchaeota archaeon]|nr:hypothetical protein [Candidatus Woesearchaeota archaeon]
MYKKYVIKEFEDNWGRSKGGAKSSGTTKTIKRPRKSAKLAELVGIILGDGNVHAYIDGKKRRSYMLRIAGDFTNDKEYLEKYVAPLCEKLFGIQAKFMYQEWKGEMFVILHSKELVLFLKSIGLKVGDKMESQVGIPGWIMKNEKYLRVCLRGLIDTDGCIHRMSRRDANLLRINFTNHNQQLLSDSRKGFLQLGFHPCNIIRKRTFYISRQEEIGRYIKQIGFSNQKHILRWKCFTAL